MPSSSRWLSNFATSTAAAWAVLNNPRCCVLSFRGFLTRAWNGFFLLMPGLVTCTYPVPPFLRFSRRLPNNSSGQLLIDLIVCHIAHTMV